MREPIQETGIDNPRWAQNLNLLWEGRRLLAYVTLAGIALSLVLAFTLPKHYESTATLMPPEQASSGAALLAAVAGRASSAGGGLGALASGLLGSTTKGEMFIDLMRSGSVGGELARRFDLQHVYRKRYMVDTLKRLNRRTSIVENKKSGLITLTVTDNDPARAQALAAAYVEELNKLLARVSTSSARRERIFVEGRLKAVQEELQDAQIQLAKFSANTSTIDVKEQTRATVDAGAKLQAQMIVSQAQLESLRQIYGDENVRVRAAREQVSVLQSQLGKISGSASDADSVGDGASEMTEGKDELYPPLRRLPALGVRWANLYRRVKVQETVFELLSAEYETARIQEAKEIGTVSVVDAPGFPEKRSFPKRTLMMIGGTIVSFLAGAAWLLLWASWQARGEDDALKSFIARVRREPLLGSAKPAAPEAASR